MILKVRLAAVVCKKTSANAYVRFSGIQPVSRRALAYAPATALLGLIIGSEMGTC